ncbi:MAG TPA: hypothetical protein PKK48_06360 [Phycisphaerae bacterium]|mgnify:CR=1 FL=1|nr:hypothetical protein [Phycisphaerae bacterium]HPS53326.1 hypothetical protein [Phycisphaerae bacterium]
MNLDLAGQICESIMLVAFGLSWPISILKSYRLKFVGGKSMWFLVLIIVGYAAGTVAKFLKAFETGHPLDFSTWLYILNGILVFIDLSLYFRYRHNHEPITKEVAEDIARIIETDMQADADSDNV